MKVLCVTYPRIGLNAGGFQRQIGETAKALSDIGVDFIYLDPWKNQIKDVDVVHIFSLDLACYYHAERAHSVGKPLVISTVFSKFGSEVWRTKLKRVLSQYVPGFALNLRLAQRMLYWADAVIALNHEERALLTRVFNVDPGKIEVIGNGIPARFFRRASSDFGKEHSVANYILNVGSIEPNKNQLNLIRAVGKIGKSLVLVGDAKPEHGSYFEACKKAAENCNVIFVGRLDYDDPMLVSAYRGASVFALPSFSEVMPLVLLEASASDCAIVASKTIPIAEELKEDARICDPRDDEAIAKAIVEAYEWKDASERAHLGSGKLDKYEWSFVAGQIKSVYQEIIRERDDQ